jgi:hypothetical protein
MSAKRRPFQGCLTVLGDNQPVGDPAHFERPHGEFHIAGIVFD